MVLQRQDNQGLIKLKNEKANTGESANGGIFMIEPTKLDLIRNINRPWSFESDFLPALAKFGWSDNRPDI